MRDEPEGASRLPDDLTEAALEQLLEAGSGGRAAMLEALVAAHPEHAAALRELSADLSGAEQILDATFPDSDPDSPATIGGHRVVRTLGEGAFGTVFLCAQEQPVARKVAAKVLRPGAGDRNTLRRFESERQLLASLSHPAITQIFDAGRLPDGRPYFVMEYVEGVPIQKYCADRELDCDQRLRLFLDLCRGVAHAHDRGIVHRDLKPANVLIVDGDGVGRPKIIDFGIAKALHPTGDADEREIAVTEAGRVIGTPGYMSPEQALGHAHDVDARTDVFALGVILYELLTGELPWAHGAAATDRTPDRPSARVTSRTTRTAVGPLRSCRPRAAELRGDLDWITLTALAQEREHRYPTVRELIADIERHRLGQPISARPPSLGYRLTKYVRRNRGVVASIAAAVLITSVATLWAIARARVAESATETAQSAAAANFATATAAVERLLARVNDDRLRHAPQSDEVRQILLQDALEFYDRFLRERASDPQLLAGRCRALLTLSQVHFQLGRFESALELAAEALIDASALHENAPDDLALRGLLADVERKKGRALAASGRVQEAAPHFVRAVEHLETCFAASPHEFALSYSSAWREVATCEQAEGRHDSGVDAHRRSVEILEEVLPSAPDPNAVRNDLVIAYGALGQELVFHGELDEAWQVLSRGAAELPKMTVDAPRAESMIESQLGKIAADRGQWPEAVARLERAVAASIEWQRREPARLLPIDTLYKTLYALGLAQDRSGAWDQATITYGRVVDCAESMVERFPEDPTRGSMLCDCLRRFAYTLWDRYRLVDLPQAEAWAERALELRGRSSTEREDATRGDVWEFEATLALIRDSNGTTDDELWERVAGSLPSVDGQPFYRSEQILEAWLGVARSRLSRGSLDAAATALAEARQILDDGDPNRAKRAVELGRLEGQLAAARGDCEAVAVAARYVLAARTTWLARQRAGECYYQAWRCASRGPEVDPEKVAIYSERARQLLRSVTEALATDVADAPDDPWFVVPWGLSGLRLAQLSVAGGEVDVACELLAECVPALERMRGLAHRDELDPAVVDEARELALSLRSGLGR